MAEKKGILTLCLVAAAGLNLAAESAARFPFPPLAGIRLSPEDAVQTSALAAVGMRRLAADLDFIRLLMYYGTTEGEDERLEEGHGHHHIETGQYLELKARTMRIIDLDPYFSYAPLYSAGALAFNLQRPQEALEVLGEASRWQPHEWKYRAYIAGIGFHEKGQGEQALRELSPVLSDPDCPTLLKNLLAFLNRRLGHRDEAIRLYRDILASRDPSYYDLARQALRQLGAPAPDPAP